MEGSMSKWIKISIFMILHVAAGYIFGIACNQTHRLFVMLFESDKELLRIFIMFIVTFCAVIFTAGLVAVLVKPLWAAAISFAAASAAILYGWNQYSLVNIGLVVIHLIIGVYFSKSVTRAFNERIKFSIRPVSENKGLMVMALILLVCGSIYLGGKEYIESQGFEIPETYFNFFMEPMKELTLNQLPPEVRHQEENKIEQEFEKLINEFQESKIKPLESYIPLASATMLFFSLYTVINIIVFVPLSLLGLSIKLLQITNFTKIIKETREVEHLVIE